tara:strand:- start:55 stop:528 length:474 start_codon:yes stop_codon:yes gene_type:complete
MEKYVKIKRYNSRYSISNKGNVISHIGKDKQLTKLKHKDGYLFVKLSLNKQSKNELIHRLVAEHFLLNENNLNQVDHIDENKKNNNVENLQWLSHKDNTRKSQSVKVYQKSIEGDIIKLWNGFGHIQEELGFNKANIHKCCIGKKPTMYGFKWCYVC